MKYLVWAYDYDEAAGGGKMLHRLCHELNEAGEEAYVGAPSGWIASSSRGTVGGPIPTTNPAWKTPTYSGPIDDGWIAVYPEIVPGNPWNATRVARWVLNVPGKFGGDRTYPPSEMVFTWYDHFYPAAPLLYLPWFDERYVDQGMNRSGALFWVGKGQAGMLPEAADPITLEMRRDPQALADALNQVERLYSFDDITGMVYIALLCGCQVAYVRGSRLDPLPFDPVAFHVQHRADLAAFRSQLAEFVRITSRGTAQIATPALPLPPSSEPDAYLGTAYREPARERGGSLTPRGLPNGSAYSERHQGSSYGYERP